jgi:hypothetical protein
MSLVHCSYPRYSPLENHFRSSGDATGGGCFLLLRATYHHGGAMFFFPFFSFIWLYASLMSQLAFDITLLHKSRVVSS